VAEERAFKTVVAYLEKQRQESIGVEEYTYSDPSSFFGRWWSFHRTEWMSDKVVLLINDYKIALTDQDVSLAEKVVELKDTIREAYEKYGSPQEDFWVVAFRVTRYA
jgi:hypothetical protein